MLVFTAAVILASEIAPPFPLRAKPTFVKLYLKKRKKKTLSVRAHYYFKLGTLCLIALLAVYYMQDTSWNSCANGVSRTGAGRGDTWTNGFMVRLNILDVLAYAH